MRRSLASAEERCCGGGKTRSGLQLLAGRFAERLKRGLLHKVGPADAECLKLRAIDAAFDPLVDSLPCHRGVDVSPCLFNAVVPACCICVSVGLAGTADAEARKRIAEVHGCQAYHSAAQRAMSFGEILEAFQHLSVEEIRPGRGRPPVSLHGDTRRGAGRRRRGRGVVADGACGRPPRREAPPQPAGDEDQRTSGPAPGQSLSRWKCVVVCCCPRALVRCVTSLDIDKCKALVDGGRWRRAPACGTMVSHGGLASA